MRDGMLRFKVLLVPLCLGAALLVAGCTSESRAAGEVEEKIYQAIRVARAEEGLGSFPADPDALKGLTPADGPETVVMDRCANLYGPARFNHKVHAEMAEMRGGCASCHHFARGRDIQNCDRCHTHPICEDGPSLLGLKGAYHHQCLGCHREWGGKKDCGFCHRKKGEAVEPKAAGRTFVAPMPKMKVYRTRHDGGTRVDFDHENHKNELRCADCHREIACTACHRSADREGPHPRLWTEKQRARHGRCFPCHGEGTDLEFDCEDCHVK